VLSPNRNGGSPLPLSDHYSDQSELSFPGATDGIVFSPFLLNISCPEITWEAILL
jgi:hypothetical protein